MRGEGFSPDKFIDREVEQELFVNVLLKFEDARLLTIRDAGGRGKSSLLKQLRYKSGWQQDPPTLASLILLDQLREPTPFALIEEVLKELTKRADTFEVEMRFGRFDKLDEARKSHNFIPFRTRISSTQISGSSGGTTGLGIAREYSRVDADDSPESWDVKKEDIARRECIKVFFEDLKEICATQPVVVLLDSWERSNLELQEWIINRVVRPLCFDTAGRPKKFGLVLAGRELPDFRQWLKDEEMYNRLVESIESLGQWKEDHVRAFLQAHGYEDVSAEENLVNFIHSKLRSGLTFDGALQWAEEIRQITGRVG
jgi:hypothetical protein